MIRRFFPILLVFFLLVAPVSATIVGVTWNQSNSSPAAFSAYWGAGYAPIPPPDFNLTEPWASMGRVVINGQTMVQVKKHYQKTENFTIGSNHYMNFSISDVPATGYTVDPWHIINGTEVPWAYIGAYEGSAYNVTTASYVGDPESINSQPGGDRLVSVAGKKPLSGLGKASLTLSGFRNMSHNTGLGWELQSFGGVSVIQRMYLIEHRNWDSQSVIGTGVTQISSGTGNEAIPTGLTGGSGANSTNCGNYTCSVATVHYSTGQDTNQISYRGIEALYGNIWKWVDFINIKANNNPWVANYGAASDVFSGSYSNTGLSLPAANGYWSDLSYSAGFDYGFLPSAVAGSSSTYISDYYYQATGNRAARLGGAWNNGAYAGAFYWYVNGAASSVDRALGARAAFTPPVVANFTHTNTSAEFAFTDESFTINTLTGLSGTPSSYNWSFGDGSLSTEQNPTHTYPAVGTYNVNLTASDGTNYATAIQSINSPNPSVIASFTPLNPAAIWIPYNVTFTDTTTGYPTEWNWTYKVEGVGPSIPFNTSQNPTFFPPSIGNFAISLNVSNAYSYNISTQSTTVTVVPPDIPIVSFTANVTSGYAPLSIRFTDTTTNDPISWLWVFYGNGDVVNSNLQSPSVAFSNPGIYSVNLTATNVNGTAYLLKSNYITVLKIPTPSDAVSCPNSSIIGAFTMLGLALMIVGGIIMLMTFLTSTPYIINKNTESISIRTKDQSMYFFGGIAIIICGSILLVLGIVILSPIIGVTGC